MRVRSLRLNSILSWLLSAFFVIGAISNIFASEEILSDYDRWGYPKWFHFVTGMLELTAAILIFVPKSRRAGSAIAAGIMLSAAATVVAHGEFSRTIAPLLVLFVALAVFLTSGAKRRRTSLPA